MINIHNPLSLYIHWPYCESKCPYCDFNSHVIEKVNDDDWIKSYTNQLYNLRSILDRFDVKFNNLNTIFFGGGTPSLMPLKIIDHILNVPVPQFIFPHRRGRPVNGGKFCMANLAVFRLLIWYSSDDGAILGSFSRRKSTANPRTLRA